jgi:hypothetical protein
VTTVGKFNKTVKNTKKMPYLKKKMKRKLGWMRATLKRRNRSLPLHSARWVSSTEILQGRRIKLSV